MAELGDAIQDAEATKSKFYNFKVLECNAPIGKSESKQTMRGGVGENPTIVTKRKRNYGNQQNLQ